MSDISGKVQQHRNQSQEATGREEAKPETCSAGQAGSPWMLHGGAPHSSAVATEKPQQSPSPPSAKLHENGRRGWNEGKGDQSGEPEPLSEEWWKAMRKLSEECAEPIRKTHQLVSEKLQQEGALQEDQRHEAMVLKKKAKQVYKFFSHMVEQQMLTKTDAPDLSRVRKEVDAVLKSDLSAALWRQQKYEEEKRRQEEEEERRRREEEEKRRQQEEEERKRRERERAAREGWDDRIGSAEARLVKSWEQASLERRTRVGHLLASLKGGESRKRQASERGDAEGIGEASDGNFREVKAHRLRGEAPLRHAQAESGHLPSWRAEELQGLAGWHRAQVEGPNGHGDAAVVALERSRSEGLVRLAVYRDGGVGLCSGSMPVRSLLCGGLVEKPEGGESLETVYDIARSRSQQSGPLSLPP